MDHHQSSLSQSLKKPFFQRLELILSAILASLPLGLTAAAEIRLAPEITLAFPQPLTLGSEAYCTDNTFYCHEKIHYFLDGGYMSLPLSSRIQSISMYSIETGVRYFPWNSWFYLGTGIGYRRITLSADTSTFAIEGEVIVTSSSINLNTFYLDPVVGLNFSLGKNLFLGMDIGVQIPFAGSGSIFLVDDNRGTNSSNSSLLNVNSEVAMGRVAHLIIPRITLLRLSWYLN